MEKKKRFLPKALFILVLLAVTGLAVFFLMPSVTFTEDKQVLERGMEYKAEDFVLKVSGEMVPEAEFIPTDEVGRHVFHYRVRRWIFERDVPFEYVVVDTIAPHLEVKAGKVIMDAGNVYTEEQMRNNVITDEGTFEIETDYDPDLPGTYPVTVKAVDDYGNESQIVYEIIVKDTTPPLILRMGDGAEILKGSTFDINDIVGYGDDTDPHPVLTYEGTVDTSRTGSYRLHATVTDASGNSDDWYLTVKVVNRRSDDEDDDYSYPFEEFKKDYDSESMRLGIDVSEWQDEIDFEAVRDAGCEFVFMRVGFSHEGQLTLDKEFRRNLEKAKEAGLKTGIYLFCYDSSEEELLSTLDSIFKEIEGVELELPIVFDWENFSHFQDYGMSFRQLNHLYEVFAREVTAHGYQSMLYGSRWYLERIWEDTNKTQVWLASYTDRPSLSVPFQFWQLTDSGMIDGIDTPVDLDIWFLEQ